MPKLGFPVLRAKDEDGDWHDIPAVISEESFKAADEAKEYRDRAQEFA